VTTTNLAALGRRRWRDIGRGRGRRSAAADTIRTVAGGRGRQVVQLVGAVVTATTTAAAAVTVVDRGDLLFGGGAIVVVRTGG